MEDNHLLCDDFFADANLEPYSIQEIYKSKLDLLSIFSSCLKLGSNTCAFPTKSDSQVL